MRALYFLFSFLILLATTLALYGQYRVYRYPGLTVDPVPLAQRVELDSGVQLEFDGAYLRESSSLQFRAFRPNVELQLKADTTSMPLALQLENIHPDARLTIVGDGGEKVTELGTDLRREIRISGLMPGEHLSLSWQFPEKAQYRFVAVGDTGGDRELDWALIRAHELDADFVLHLGDIYYHESELGGVGERLNRARVPVYTANGNHDFRGPKGNSFKLFMQNIGPLNARFELLGQCFINLDTGAYMYPAHKGERASLLAAELVNQQHEPKQCTEYIIFTHKPLVEAFEAEFPKRDHALHGYDSYSLVRQLQDLGRVTILAGHIHADFEFEQDGLKTYVTGSGLAHADLLQGNFTARVLVGTMRTGQPVQFEWALNQMPMEYHCSKKVYNALQSAESSLQDSVREGCASGL